MEALYNEKKSFFNVNVKLQFVLMFSHSRQFIIFITKINAFSKVKNSLKRLYIITFTSDVDLTYTTKN